jgi:hypothetical protein
MGFPRGRTRPDLGADCPEKMDMAFLKFIVTTYYRRKRTIHKVVDDLTGMGSIQHIYLLRSKKDIQDFLNKYR